MHVKEDQMLTNILKIPMLFTVSLQYVQYYNLPPLSGTERAMASDSLALPSICRLSRSHCTTDPLYATDPSSAYTAAAA